MLGCASRYTLWNLSPQVTSLHTLHKETEVHVEKALAFGRYSKPRLDRCESSLSTVVVVNTKGNTPENIPKADNKRFGCNAVRIYCAICILAGYAGLKWLRSDFCRVCFFFTVVFDGVISSETMPVHLKLPTITTCNAPRNRAQEAAR